MAMIKRQPPKKLEVTVYGQPIRGSSAADVFVAALNSIGLEKIVPLALCIGPNAIVSSVPHPTDRGSKRCGNWYVLTHSSTREKKAIIEQVADKIGVEVHVRIVEPVDIFPTILAD